MAQYFFNVPELQKAKMNDLIEIIEQEIQKICKEVVRQSIKKNVYKANITSNFGHAAEFPWQQLARAVTFKIVKKTAKYVEFEIYIDPKKLEQHNAGAHRLTSGKANFGRKKGADVRSQLPHWIESGTSRNPIINYPATRYMWSANQKLRNGSDSVYNQLIQAFKSRGWDVR